MNFSLLKATVDMEKKNWMSCFVVILNKNTFSSRASFTFFIDFAGPEM